VNNTPVDRAAPLASGIALLTLAPLSFAESPIEAYSYRPERTKPPYGIACMSTMTLLGDPDEKVPLYDKFISAFAFV
jgi:hypothetical protein